jgi:hypothetical protein
MCGAAVVQSVMSASDWATGVRFVYFNLYISGQQAEWQKTLDRKVANSWGARTLNSKDMHSVRQTEDAAYVSTIRDRYQKQTNSHTSVSPRDLTATTARHTDNRISASTNLVNWCRTQTSRHEAGSHMTTLFYPRDLWPTPSLNYVRGHLEGFVSLARFV